MNPAVLNYLQSQQVEQPSQEMQPQGQQSYNPFDSGIRAAIESARVSLDMTEKQQDKALRRSMLSFANAYGNEPKRKGFIGNFGAVARSLSPAILAHDESEDLAFKENNNLANQILAYQAAEQQRQAQQEERNWHRQHAENQLAEQRRYHDMMDSYHNRQLQNNDLLASVDQDFIPITSKSELAPYLKSKTALGTVLKSTEHLEKKYHELREKYKDNIFDPMGRGSTVTNYAKNITGNFLANKDLQQEANDIEAFNSLLNEYVASSERELKGGGSTGAQILEYFESKNIYPNFYKDNPKLFQSKLNTIKEKIEDGYKAANLSAKYKVHIDPLQVNDFENKLKSQETPIGNNTNKQTVFMQDQNGNEYEIPAHEVNEAIQDGLSLIEG